MKFLALLTSLVLMTSFSRADSENSVFQLKVPDMSCQSCVLSVSEEVKRVDQVADIFIDLKTKTVLIASKASEAPKEASVVEAVRVAGYQARDYKKLDKSFAEAKAELVKKKN